MYYIWPEWQFFIELLKLAEGGGGIFILKINLRYIFICTKQCTLRYIFISKIYRIVLIPNYKRMYYQSDQTEK